MNNITIGQYVHGDSWIYKMDPRVKIISLVLAMVITFIIPSFIMMAVLLGLTILMVFTTGIPVMKMIRGMKALLFLLTFTFIIQIFNIRTGDKLVDVNMTLGWASIGAIVLIVVLYHLYKKQFKYRSTLFLVMAFSLFLVQYLLPYGEI